MLFTSYEFIGFVALLLVLYYLIPKRFQWMLLLVASYVFYILADPMYLPYILVTTFTTYAAALIMQKDADKTSDYLKLHKEDMEKDARKAYKAARKKVRARVMTLCILINVGILMFVKYVNFIIGNVNSVLQVGDPAGQFALLDVIVPMGISFYTFMALSYLIDVYRGTVRAESNPGKLALFITFFPHIVQGPISRYGDLSVTLFEEHAFDKTKVSFGLQRIMWGFFKKLVVADRIMPAVTTVIGDTEGGHRGMYALVCVIFYTIELYADFTGGIDITTGIAEALGITVKENFERPYFSMSLKEYWRRWHITMCSWFRDYIFYPVSGSKWLQKFTKFSRKTFGEKVGRRLPVYISSFIVWFTTGLWHGASANFALWGLYYFVFLIIEKYIFRGKKIPVIGNIYALIAVTFGWVLFRFDSFIMLKTAISGLFAFTSGNASKVKLYDIQLISSIKSNIFLLIYVVLACTPLFKWIGDMIHKETNGFTRILSNILNVVVPAIMLGLATLSLVGNSYNPFLYFRF